MGADSPIEWTDATWNPLTGCTKISPGCKHCLAPETLVLMLDGSWKPIGGLRVGDRLLAFDEEPGYGKNRLLRESVVQTVWETTAPIITFKTASGREVTCSENHLWLHSNRPWFRRADSLSLTSTLKAMGDPSIAAHTDQADYQAGYVAGVTAGDGTMRWDPSWRSDKFGYPQMYWRVAVLATDDVILKRLQHYLANVGVQSEIRPFRQVAYGKNKPKDMSKVECRSYDALARINSLLVERDSLAWKAGWLAGFLDTDGSSDGKTIRWAQMPGRNDYLQRTERYVQELGFRANIEAHYGKGVTTARLKVTNLNERLSFVGAINPALPRKNTIPYLGTKFIGMDDKVVSVSRGPVRNLVDITTSTRTFIAEGLATHNCYAERMSLRLRAMGQPNYANGFALALHEDMLTVPLRWKKPRRVFVNSMSDLFQEGVPLDFIRNVFEVMKTARQHQFQILTKRSDRLLELSGKLRWTPNIWMGVSVEHRKYAFRIDHLRQTGARVRFLSLEPLLGPLTNLDLAGIEWVIVGGESGPGARPMAPGWVKDIRDQCVASGVAFFFKQWGGTRKNRTGRVLDGRTWDEYPLIKPSPAAKAESKGHESAFS
ncbi:MAG: DUF5131 family protein [Burkholderiales bacterium]